MVAVGESKIPGTNAAVQIAVPQAGVPVYFGSGALGPRDATGASEAIDEHTSMEQLLGEALAEFELDEPADVWFAVRCPVSNECWMREGRIPGVHDARADTHSRRL